MMNKIKISEKDNNVIKMEQKWFLLFSQVGMYPKPMVENTVLKKYMNLYHN